MVKKTSKKDILLKLCHLLSQKEVDPDHVKPLLKEAGLAWCNNPMELANAVLKQLHGYQEHS